LFVNQNLVNRRAARTHLARPIFFRPGINNFAAPGVYILSGSKTAQLNGFTACNSQWLRASFKGWRNGASTKPKKS